MTSTVSANGDQGADPNRLVKVVDVLRAIDPPPSVADDDRENPIGRFVALRTAQAGEVLRGVAFAPNEDDADDR